MPRLFWKIFLSFWITQAIVLFVVVVFANLGVGREEPQSIDQIRQSEPALALQAVKAWESGGRAALKDNLAESSEDTGARLWLFDSKGQELSGNPAPWWVSRFLATRAGAPAEDAATAPPVVEVQGGRGHYLLVAEPGLPRGLRIPFGSISRQVLVGLLVSGVTCFLLANYLAKPIVRLRKAAQEVAAGDLSARAGTSIAARRDEIGELVVDFDRMAGRIETLVQSQKQLLRDISHDLRSPLQRLRMAVGLARRHDASLNSQLDRMEAELVRINDLVEQVLTLARLEATVKMPVMTELSLNEIIDKVVSDAKFEAEGIGADIRGSAASNISMMANEELLLSAIENVVRNAIHHTDPGSTVEVDLSVKNGGALIVVRDHGGGVPEGEIAKLFQPFYRVDDARGANGGFGLGLAIAATAIQLHHGTIHAYNEHPGLRVELWLPQTPAG